MSIVREGDVGFADGEEKHPLLSDHVKIVQLRGNPVTEEAVRSLMSSFVGLSSRKAKSKANRQRDHEGR